MRYYNVILANRNEEQVGENLAKAIQVFEKWEKTETERGHKKFMGSIEIVNDQD
jgi:hypothetical protein